MMHPMSPNVAGVRPPHPCRPKDHRAAQFIGIHGGNHSYKEHQAPGTRHQAPGTRHQAPGTRHQAPGTRHQAPGTRHQAQAQNKKKKKKNGGWGGVPGDFFLFFSEIFLSSLSFLRPPRMTSRRPVVARGHYGAVVVRVEGGTPKVDHTDVRRSRDPPLAHRLAATAAAPRLHAGWQAGRQGTICDPAC